MIQLPVHMRFTRYFVFFLVVYYLVGIIGIAIPAIRPLFVKLSPFSLILGFGMLILFHKNLNKNSLVFFLSIFILGFLLEVVGVKTGKIFGVYHYGNSLGIKLAGVPLLIGLNWVMLIYCSISAADRFPVAGQFKLLLAALFLVVFDLAMEPVAPFMDMWHWPLGIAPLQNYVAWFFTSLIFITIGKSFRTNFDNKLAPALFIIQFLFFVSLNLVQFFL
jgi:putative membrane protein